MILDKNFFFSQHALNIFRICPIRFQKRYIEGLYWKDGFENRSIETGRNFHILADRYFSDVSLNMEFFEEYGELNDWMDALKDYVPKKARGQYYPEYQLKIQIDDIKLQAKYDLLHIDGSGKLIIYDWKTQQSPIGYRDLASSIQTRVYRYVLAMGGHRLKGESVDPEDIIMKYWQPAIADRTVELSYSIRERESDGRFLKDMIEKIKGFDYNGYDKTKSKRYCSRCEFNYFCNTDRVKYGHLFEQEEIELDDWADIDEIPI
ncbi:MAG: PD-(D/E)XK nuclease family protein [Clostridiales bacterium]|nr:PD-(D/E)XK nuclease family protein [Clostridiales bacterium]